MFNRIRNLVPYIVDGAVILLLIQSIKEHDTTFAAINGVYVGFIANYYLRNHFRNDDDDKGHDKAPDEPPDNDGGLALSVRNQINEILLATEKPVKV